MRQGFEWTAQNFRTNFAVFKVKHPEFYSWDYKVTGNDVVYVFSGPGAAYTQYSVGYLYDVGSWDFTMLENHLLNVLRVQESEYERKQKMEDQQEKLNAKAKEDGNFWGSIFVAIAKDPSLPNMMMFKLTSKLGKAVGYSDTDSNDAFKFAFMDAVDSYKNANTKALVLDSGTYNLE